MTTPPFTIDDLEKAKADLQRWIERRDNYDGNNPDKYHTDIQLASDRVETITHALKASGALEKSDEERLNEILDKLFPNAPSGTSIKHEGNSYRRRYRPSSKSRSGTVTSWYGWWERVRP